MSTFTDWNGPQGCDGGGATPPSMQSIIELINAYNQVRATLESHIEQTTSAGDVHQSKTYVDGQITTVNTSLTSASNNAANAIADLQTEATADFKTALVNKFQNTAGASLIDASDNKNNTVVAMLQKIWNNLNTAINNVKNNIGTLPENTTVKGLIDAINAALGNVVPTSSTGTIYERIKLINDALGTKPVGSNTIYSRLGSIETQLNNNTFTNITVEDTTISKSVETTYIKNEITRIEYNPNESQLTKLYLGTSDTGANVHYWHILGMLTDNVGTAYIKFKDSYNFAAIVDFAVNDSQVGIINVAVARVEGEWLKTSLAICRATDNNGDLHYYLCIAKDGLSENQMLQWKPSVSGINFVSPMLSDKYIVPVSSGTAAVVAQVDLSDYVPCENIIGSTSGVNADSDGIPVGFGIRWPANGNTLPAKYIRAEGQEVSLTDYPELAAAWGIQADTFTIPAENCTIFKYKS